MPTNDGRLIAFTSYTGNLADEETYCTFDDVFIHVRLTGQTTRVSRHTNGAHGNGDSFSPVISSDGLLAAFVSEATSLVDDDTNGAADIFVREHELARGKLDHP